MVQFFGQYLIGQEAISNQQLREALELMSRTNLPLGQVAVEKGLITNEQANQINHEQRYTDRHFGAIATTEGLLSAEQVEVLLNEQAQRRLRIGEALVQLNHLSEQEMHRHLSHFENIKAEHEGTERSDLPGYLLGNRLAEDTLEFIPRAIRRMSQLQIKMPTTCAPVEQTSRPIIATVLIRLEQGLRIALCTDEAFADELVYGVFGIPPVGVGDLDIDIRNDAVGQFLSIVAGTVLASLEQAGLEADSDPPILGVAPRSGYAFELVCTSGRATLILGEP